MYYTDGFIQGGRMQDRVSGTSGRDFEFIQLGRFVLCIRKEQKIGIRRGNVNCVQKRFELLNIWILQGWILALKYVQYLPT